MIDSNQWGVELKGGELDKNIWRALLKSPFDPYIGEVHGVDAPYLALRSTAFDGLPTSSQVFAQTKGLFARINMAMAANANAGPVSPGAVIEFLEEGIPRRHYHIEAESGTIRIQGGLAEATVRDAQGNIIEPPPAASVVQNWMRAAAIHPGVADAMNYVSGSPGWVNLYKAHEVLHDNRLAPGAISQRELKRFTRTTNTEDRHRDGKYDPPVNPMPLWEGRSLIITWLAAAIEQVLRPPE